MGWWRHLGAGLEVREEDVRIDRSPVPLSGLFWGLSCEGEKKRERFRHSLSTGRLAASLFSTVYHEIDYGWKRLEIRVRPNNLKIILKKKKKKKQSQGYLLWLQKQESSPSE